MVRPGEAGEYLVGGDALREDCELAAELERLRMLKEFELGVAVPPNEMGDPLIVDTDIPKRGAF